MDSEIFASERAHHARFRLIYRLLASLLMLGTAAAIVYSALQSTERAARVTLAGVVLITLGIVGAAWWTRRPQEGMLVSPSPWSYGQVYSRDEQKRIWNAMGKVIVAFEMSFTRLTPHTALCERRGTFFFRKGTHLIDVRPSQDHPGWRVITVFSAPDLPTTITDFGRGAVINQELLTVIPHYVAPGEVSENE